MTVTVSCVVACGEGSPHLPPARDAEAPTLDAGAVDGRVEPDSGLLAPDAAFADAAMGDAGDASDEDGGASDASTVVCVPGEMLRLASADGYAGSVVSVSSDGRFVVFDSSDDTLVAGDQNGLTDTFLLDRISGVRSIVSVSRIGGARPGGNASASSADGRFVLFASNGVFTSGDLNHARDYFIWDQLLDSMELVTSVPGGGGHDGTWVGAGVMSDDGNVVAFTSDATNLVSNDANGPALDVFVVDRAAGTIVLANVSSTGEQSNGSDPGGLGFVALGGDGRFVAFLSNATNLVAGTDARERIYVRDLVTGETRLASSSALGEPADSDVAQGFSLSGDGRRLAFVSDASNLVPGLPRLPGTMRIFVKDLQTGAIEVGSLSSAGALPDHSCWRPALSRNGRYLAFYSGECTLAGDPGPCDVTPHVYIRDLYEHRNWRITGAPTGPPMMSVLWPLPRWNGSGDYLGFISDLPLVPPDTNDGPDAFVYSFCQGR